MTLSTIVFLTLGLETALFFHVLPLAGVALLYRTWIGFRGKAA